MPEPVREDPARFADPIIGWRAWHLRRTAEGPALVAATSGRGDWPARQAFVARCRVGAHSAASGPDPSPHGSPVLGCTCGIYASDALESLIAPGRRFPPVPVLGTVSLWGRVIEHRAGWRAEFAYPDRLRLVCVVCLSRGTGSGIPERVVEMRVGPGGSGSKIEPLCAAHVAGRAASGTRLYRSAHDVQAELLSRYAVDLLPFEAIEHVLHGTPVPRPRVVAAPAPAVRPWLSEAAIAEAASAVPTRAPVLPDDGARPSAPSVPPTLVAPTTPSRPPLRTRALDVGQRIVSAVLTVVFWVFMAWWGCSDMIVTVDGP
jgi:hypothetical protein